MWPLPEHMLRISREQMGQYQQMLILKPPVQFIFRKGYYNTFRGSSFVHDSWKKKLSQAHIRIIEKGCEKFMSTNKYERFSQERRPWIYACENIYNIYIQLYRHSFNQGLLVLVTVNGWTFSSLFMLTNFLFVFELSRRTNIGITRHIHKSLWQEFRKALVPVSRLIFKNIWIRLKLVWQTNIHLKTIKNAVIEIGEYHCYCCSDAIFGWRKVSFSFFLFVYLF